MTTSYNKGKAEGKDEANRENACKMKELGVSPAIISQVTGMTEEKIEKV